MECSATPAVAHNHGRRGRGSNRRDLREAEILDGTSVLLTEKPLAEITVTDVTRAAGISRSSFYFYFDSRDAAVRALAERAGASIRDAITGFVAAIEDGRTADIRTGIAEYVACWRESGPLLRALRTQAATDPGLRGVWTRTTDDICGDLAAAIEHAQSAGLLPPAPPAGPDLAYVLFAMLYRAASEFPFTSTDPTAEDRLVDTLAAVFQRSLDARPQPGSAPPRWPLAADAQPRISTLTNGMEIR